MALVFDEAKHEYQLDGVVLPSVTEICKFLTMNVSEGANREARDAAAERGHRVHEACTMHDFEGDECEVDGDIVGYVEAYAAFKRDYQIKEWLMYEHPMASKHFGFAGTLDRLGIIDGCKTIIDIKSGSTVHKLAWAAQLEGYRTLLFDEELVSKVYDPSENCKRNAILKLKNDGKYTLYRDLDDKGVFHSCLNLAHHLENWREDNK